MLRRLQQASLFWARKTLSNPISRQGSGSLLRLPKVPIWVPAMVYVWMAAYQKLPWWHLLCLSAFIATRCKWIEAVTQEYETICLFKCDLLDSIKTSEPWSILLLIILQVSRFPSFFWVSHCDLFPPMSVFHQDSSHLHLLLFFLLLHFSCHPCYQNFFQAEVFQEPWAFPC